MYFMNVIYVCLFVLYVLHTYVPMYSIVISLIIIPVALLSALTVISKPNRSDRIRADTSLPATSMLNSVASPGVKLQRPRAHHTSARRHLRDYRREDFARLVNWVNLWPWRPLPLLPSKTRNDLLPLGSDRSPARESRRRSAGCWLNPPGTG